MTVADHLWTCPDCSVTETVEGHGEPAAERRRLVQAGHAARHAAERARGSTLAEALAEAVLEATRPRVVLVVAPGELARLREQIKRRGAQIEVRADAALPPGRGYVVRPRRGVRGQR